MTFNLFSPFNPVSSNSFSSLWMLIYLSTIIMPALMWLSKSMFIFTMIKLIEIMVKQFSNMLNKSMKTSIISFISIMYLVLLMNITGLFPYAFPITSHPQMTLSISVPMWSAIMMMKLNHPIKLLSHLVPPSTPSILIPFMVMVESISLIIQPLTLAIRLMANITAGHILLSLMSTAYNPTSFTPLIISQSILTIMEMCVALIQAYVMSMLMIMYTK